MYQWLDERLDLTRLNNKLFRKVFPVHHTFFLGEITLFAFIVLVLTGVFLTLTYEPSTRLVKVEGYPDPVQAAYASILYIDSLPFGAVIRSVHHWSAHIMIAAAFLHLLRILLSGAYKKPRELNWIIGILMLVTSIVIAFLGYALPYDNYAITATRIGHGIAESVPWVGVAVAQIMFGGDFPGSEHNIPRLSSLHVLGLPLALMGLIGAHLLLMVKQKHTQPKYAEKVAPGKILGVPALPQQGMMSGVLFLVYVAVVFLIAGGFLAHPVEAYGPLSANTPNVKPDWYFLWIYGLLKIIPSSFEFTIPLFGGGKFGPEFWGGVVIPSILLVGAMLIPFFSFTEGNVKQRYLELPSRHPRRTSLTIAGLMFLIMSTMAGYIGDTGMEWLTIGRAWLLIILVPIVTYFVSFWIMRAIWGHTWRDEPQVEFISGPKGSAADD